MLGFGGGIVLGCRGWFGVLGFKEFWGLGFRV